MPEPRWGEVWDVDFGVPSGHERGATRPAVVVSADWFNKTRAELHLVIPFSSTIRQIGTHWKVEPPEGGLDSPSDAMCEHLRSVAADRFVERRGKLEPTTMEELMKRLKVLLLMGRKGANDP
jgi:mRNA interferase MazF